MLRPVSLVIAAAVAVGCAKKTADPSPAPAALTTDRIGWSGNFQQVQQVTASAAPTSRNRASGTVSLVPVVGNPDRAKISINVSAPVQVGATLAWGVYPGRCGSGTGMAMPLTSTASLPTLEVLRNGGASLSSEIALALPKSGTFHVNVYHSTRATDLSDVLTCANLRAETVR